MSGGPANQSAGQAVTLSGRAADLKAGAALILDDGRTVLIEGRHSWGSALRGTRVVLAGVLRYVPPSPPDPTVQQVSGGTWYLEPAPTPAERDS